MNLEFLKYPLIILALGIAMWLTKPETEVLPPEVTPSQPRLHTHRLERPQFCADLLRDDPGKWDPETDTYPRNLEWEACIGVIK